jgi:hypothetical protein
LFSFFFFLVKLLMLTNYTKRTNIWKFLTPLDSTHLEVFLRILWDFFIFEFKFKFWNWTGFQTGFLVRLTRLASRLFTIEFHTSLLQSFF